MNLQPVETRFFTFAEKSPHTLRSGAEIGPVTIAYETWGRLSPERDNAVLVFHAMTGSQHAAGENRHVHGVEPLWTDECHSGWWSGFIGPGLAIDTDNFFVICANYLGGCYGSTGPRSINPATGKPYGSRFPSLRIPDLVEVQLKLVDHLGIDRLHAVIGASVGGMMALSLATLFPDRVRTVIPIGTGIEVTPLQRILNFEQAFAITSDPDFQGGDYYEGPFPDCGLALARMIAHKTFVSLDALERRARRDVNPGGDALPWYLLNHPLESYMLHQGRKFVHRFDANSYLRILDAWQHYDLLREAGADSMETLFKKCRDQRFLIFSIDSDVSFYPGEQELLAHHLRDAGVQHLWVTVHSDKGHDSFLLEPELYHPHLAHTLADS